MSGGPVEVAPGRCAPGEAGVIAGAGARPSIRGMDDRPVPPPRRPGRRTSSGEASRTPAQSAGDAAEAIVADRLSAAGWRILGRNVHVGRHELDIVAVDPGPPSALVVVEVRWRRRRDFGFGEETVDHGKRTRVRSAAYALLERDDLPHLPLRFDLVVVEPDERGGEPRIRHHRAAF